MHLLEGVEINNFLNLRSAKLENFTDFNIIVGPNNSGKTSILRGITLLERINIESSNNFPCKTCQSFFNGTSILSLNGEINQREKYLNKHKVEISYKFNYDEIEGVLPYLKKELEETLNGPLANLTQEQMTEQVNQLRDSKDSKRIQDSTYLEQTYKLKTHARKEFAEPKIVLKETPDRRLQSEHLSFLLNKRFSDDILKTIVFCPDERLDIYKGKSVPDFIRSKNLSASEQTVMVRLLKELVDLKLHDMRQNMELIRLVESARFDTAISEQGSGVKSLICLFADILAGTKNKILLIDEPELGLNQSGKQAFLKFLLSNSQEKQVFIATHDPTFVNPVLWGNRNVSVFLFSVIDEKFVKINLRESKADPNTFAGYLPHTTSIKEFHIYVEGSLDVYNLQIFIERYVKMNFENWYEIINKIGIYHLAGGFWCHLLYTIPEKPYFSIVILDGDKRKEAGEVIKKYDAIKPNKFRFFSSIDDLKKLSYRKKSYEDIPIPVLCLKKSEIEEYLEPKPALKENGPFIAQQMKDVPEEISEILSVAFKLAQISFSTVSKQSNNRDL